jgi:hypothetical protein
MGLKKLLLEELLLQFARCRADGIRLLSFSDCFKKKTNKWVAVEGIATQE